MHVPGAVFCLVFAYLGYGWMDLALFAAAVRGAPEQGDSFTSLAWRLALLGLLTAVAVLTYRRVTGWSAGRSGRFLVGWFCLAAASGAVLQTFDPLVPTRRVEHPLAYAGVLLVIGAWLLAGVFPRKPDDADPAAGLYHASVKPGVMAFCVGAAIAFVRYHVRS